MKKFSLGFLVTILLLLMLVGSVFAASAGYEDTTTIKALQTTGETISTSGVRVLWRDNSGNKLVGTGTTVPTNGTSGWAKGALFIDTDVVAGTIGLFQNIGSTTSCNFDAITTGAATACTNAQMLVADVNGLLTCRTLSGDATISNSGVVDISTITYGTDAQMYIATVGGVMTARTMSGDATISNTGALTIGNNKIGAAELNYTVETVTIANATKSGTTAVTSGAVIIGYYITSTADSSDELVSDIGISGTTLTLTTIANVSGAETYNVIVMEP